MVIDIQKNCTSFVKVCLFLQNVKLEVWRHGDIFIYMFCPSSMCFSFTLAYKIFSLNYNHCNLTILIILGEEYKP